MTIISINQTRSQFEQKIIEKTIKEIYQHIIDSFTMNDYGKYVFEKFILEKYGIEIYED